MTYDIPTELQTNKNYTNIQTYIPPMKLFLDLSNNNTNIIFDNKYKICDIDISNNKIKVLVNDKIINIDTYLKVTHILDPIKFCQNKDDTEIHMKKKNDIWNQAYIETVASYILGKLKDENISPHFNSFYGAFTAIANKYSYNVTDEVESYRMYKWFWSSIENKFMNIEVQGEDEETKKDIYDEIMNKPDYCLELNEEDNETEELSVKSDKLDDLESLESASIKTTSEKEDSDESENESEDDDEYKVYLNLEKFPVMMIFSEKNLSTIDDLLDDFDTVGSEPNTQIWEDKWTAWTFQIIAALCVIQKLFGFIHNDLHTNNIVYIETNEKYLYYTTNDKKIFRVPTYGKIFKIIDFGRAIFSINDHLFVSDDFREGNDAATQYNFPPLILDSEEENVYPNPSFDLVRLAISYFESIFPEQPNEKKDGAILSNEPNRVVKETTSELYNLLWSWLIDKDGKNILFDDDGDERFPDFGLYVHIASSCKNGVPKDQINKKPFTKFIINSSLVSKNTKIYNLYI